MSLRTKFILTFILLLLALFCVAFSAKSTMQTVQKFRQQNAMANSGDVRTVDQWMTIPYIAHTYRVPETYLYSQLHLSNSRTLRHTTLEVLATRYKQPTSHLISEVQQAILAYRKLHSLTAMPAFALMMNKKDQVRGNKQ